MRPAPAHVRVWTPGEDAILREHYATAGARAISAMLDGRTEIACWKRALKLGLKKKPRWTAAEDRRLRFLWDTTASLRTIAREVGHPYLEVYRRAQLLGLPLGVPAGHEYLFAAAERTGYQTSQLWRILRWAGAALHPVRARRAEGSRVQPRHYVDPFDVDEAIERWHRTESVEAAAERHGVNGERLRAWLRDAGVPDPRRRPKEHWRVESETIDRVVSERRALVSLRRAAAELGTSVHRVRTALERAGIPRPAGKLWLVRLDEARAALGRRVA